MPDNVFVYDRPPSASDLLGMWPNAIGSLLLGGTFHPDGTFTGWNEGANVTGTYKPHPSGKNLFEITFKIGAWTISGIGFVSKTLQGRSTLSIFTGSSSNFRLIVLRR